MSQSVEINAARNLNNGTGNVQGERFASRKTDSGRPMYRDQHSNQLRTLEPNQPETPMTSLMPQFAKHNLPPVSQANPSAVIPKRKVFHYSLSKNDEIQLTTCKNAWVPSYLKVKDANNNCQPMSKEDMLIEEIRKKFLSILNKVSPENMALLADSIMSLPIKTENCMKKVIELLFQKAIDEPNFSPQYAYICTVMQKREAKPKDERSKSSFKKLLTNFCQNRLYQMRVHGETLAKDLQAIDDCKDQDVKEQLQYKYNQDEMIYRKRSVGNCRFMCELYNVDILTNQILEMSMKYLLKSPNEETLECVCNILKLTGKKLSHNTTFKKLKEFTSADYKTKIPTRIRFMIQDIIELKENDWIPRNARPKGQFCNIKAPQSTGEPMNGQYKPLAPILISTKNISQKPNEQTKPPTEIRKIDMCLNNELVKATVKSGVKQTSLPIDSGDIVKINKSSALPCLQLVTKSTDKCRILDVENIDVEETEKKFRFIIDSITSENMVLLADSIISLSFKTYDCLKKVVEYLFQMAMDKPTLTPQYAYICSLMKNKEVQSNEQKTKTSFRILLIALCQNTFESMDTRKRIVAKDRNEIESCRDKETRKRLQSKFEQNELDYRKRCVANCRFICELLKVNILVPSILEMCAAKLVESPKETSIECVCVMLKHAGNAFDYSGVFEVLHKYATAPKQKLSSRILSVIWDTLEPKNSDLAQRQQPSPDVQLVMPMAPESIPPKINIEIVKEQLQNKPFSDKQKLSVYKTVESVINSVTAENVNASINELAAQITSIDVMEKTVEFIFARANIRPESIPELVQICSSLKKTVVNTTQENAKPISLKKQVLIRCNQVLQSGVQSSSENGFTHKEPFKFVGELFNANVLSAHTLLEFLQIIPDKLTNRGLDNTCCLLKAAGKKLEQVHNLKKTIRKLMNMVSNDMEGIYSQRSNVLLKELVELRGRKWVF